MPFGVKSAGFNSTTLKKLRIYLADKETYNAKSLSGLIDVELDCVENHMAFLGYKKDGTKMAKSDHKEYVAGLNITKRNSIADVEDAQQTEDQANVSRKLAADAETAELALADAKSGKSNKAA